MDCCGMRHLCGMLGGTGCQTTSSLQAVRPWAGRGLRDSRGGASQSRWARATSELAVWRESSIDKIALVWRRSGSYGAGPPALTPALHSSVFLMCLLSLPSY